MKEAELYDGEVLEFPDDTPDDVIAYKVKIETAKKQGISPENWSEPGGVPGGFTMPESMRPPPSEGLTDYIMRNITELPGETPGAVDFAGRGIAKGAAKLIGAPMDVINAVPVIAGKVTGNDWGPVAAGGTPIIGGSQFYMDLLDTANEKTAELLGVEPPQTVPSNMFERIAERGGEELGASAFPVARSLSQAERYGTAGLRKIAAEEAAAKASRTVNPAKLFQRNMLSQSAGVTAPSIGTAALKTGGTLSKEALATLFSPVKTIGRGMTQAAAADPRKFVLQEALASASAGTGGALAQEYMHATGVDPESRGGQIGDLVGAVLGVLAGTGTAGLLKLGGQTVSSLWNPKNYMDQVVKDEVVDRLAKAGLPGLEPGQPIDIDPLVQAIETNPKISDAIPGVTETMADRTRSPGLASLEYQRQSGPNAGMFKQRRDANAVAIDTALQAERPNAPPSALSSELGEQRQRREMERVTQLEQAQATSRTAQQAVQPRGTAESRGTDIRTGLETASERAWNDVGEAWDVINQSGQPVDLAPLAQTFQEATEALPEALRQKFAPPEAAIPARLSQAEAPVDTGLIDPRTNQPIMRQPEAPVRTIQEVTGLRSALSTAVAEARDKAGHSNEERILQGYIDRIDDYLANNIPPELRQQYEAARNARVEYGQRFEQPQTAIGQTLRDRRGQPAVPASTIPQKFVQSDQGRLEDFNSLIREAGHEPQVREAIRGELLEDINKRGLLDHPDDLEAYLGQYRTVLDQFPQLRQELTAAGGARRGVTTAETELQRHLREEGTATTKGTSVSGKYLSWSENRAAEAMQEVINARKPGEAAAQLLASANNSPEAIEGARAAFWEHLEKQARSKGGTTGTLEQGVQPWIGGKLRNFLDDPKNMEVARELWKDNPEHLDNIEKIVTAMQGLDVRIGAKAPGTSGTPQSVLPSAESISSLTLALKRGQISPAWMAARLLSVVARRGVRGARAEAIGTLLDQALLNPDLAAALMKNNNPANREALRRIGKAWIGKEADALANILSGEEDASDEEKAINGAPAK